MKKMLKKFMKDDKEAPRALPEIEKEYSQLAAQLGQNTYQSAVLKKDADALLERILRVNQEAFKRKQLDNAAAAAASVKSEGENA